MISKRKYQTKISIKIIPIAFLIVFFFPATLAADLLILRNGRQYSGRLMSQNRRVIRFRIKGRIRSFSKRKIKRIKYGLTSAEKAKRARIKVRLDQARFNKKRMGSKGRVTEEDEADLLILDGFIKKLEMRLRREERKQQAELKRRERMAAKLERELRNMEREEKKIEREEARLKEKQKKLAEKRRKMRERRERKRRGEKEPEDDGESFLDRMLGGDIGGVARSAVLPGWGQFNRGKKIRGGLFLAGTILPLGYLFNVRSAHATLQSDYNADTNLAIVAATSGAGIGPTMLFNARANDTLAVMNKASNYYTTASFIALTVYLINVADAYFKFRVPGDIVNRTKSQESGQFSFIYGPSPALRYSGGYENRGVFSYRLRF